MSRTSIAWVWMWLLGLAAVASAESEAALVARTQLLEAQRAGEHAQVLVAYAALRELGPVAPDLSLAYADACYELDRLLDAEQALEQVLEQRGDDPHALSRLAVVRGRRAGPGAVKPLLFRAARAGRLVLRDLRAGEAQRVLGCLLDDSGFVVKVMHAGYGVRLEGAARNPFRSPLRSIDAPPEPPLPPDVQGELRVLAEAIHDAFRVLARQHRDGDVQAVARTLAEVRELLARYEAELGPVAFDVAEQQLQIWFDELGEAEELYQAVLLQLHVQRGNGLLRQMHAALRDDDYDGVAALHARLEALVEVMRGQPRAVFARNAEALQLRGQTLAERAATLATIARLRLEVTGVVVPGDGSPARAIVNDRIHEVGDLVLEGGPEERVYEGVRLLSIQPAAVRFRYAGVEFVRTLAQRR
jgi:hypothetical protein